MAVRIRCVAAAVAMVVAGVGLQATPVPAVGLPVQAVAAPVVTLTASCGDGSWWAELVVVNESSIDEVRIVEFLSTGVAAEAFSPAPAATVLAPATRLFAYAEVPSDRVEVAIEVVLESVQFDGAISVERSVTRPTGCDSTPLLPPATCWRTPCDTEPDPPAVSVPGTTVAVTPATSVVAVDSTPALEPGQAEAEPGESGAEAGDELEGDLALQFQPAGEMVVDRQYLVEALVFFADQGPVSPLNTFDPAVSTTEVELEGATCGIRVELKFTPGDFDVDSDGVQQYDMCSGRREAAFNWTVTPRRASTMILRLVVTSVDTGFQLLAEPARIVVSGVPATLVAGTAAPVGQRAADPEAGVGATDAADDGGDSTFPVLPLALTGAAGVAAAGGWSQRRRWRSPQPQPGAGSIAAAAADPTTRRPVFISYDRDNSRFLDRVDADLQRAGFDTWRDTEDIAPGVDWPTEIARAINTSAAVVLLLSPQSVESPNVAGEIALARQADKRVFPLVIADGTQLKDSLAYNLALTQQIDLRGDRYANGLAELVAALRRLTES